MTLAATRTLAHRISTEAGLRRLLRHGISGTTVAELRAAADALRRAGAGPEALDACARATALALRTTATIAAEPDAYGEWLREGRRAARREAIGFAAIMTASVLAMAAFEAWMA